MVSLNDAPALACAALAVAQGCLMLYAAVHDARTRTFPNGLAAAFALVCAFRAVVIAGWRPGLHRAAAGPLVPGAFSLSDGLRALGGNAALASFAFIALFTFEFAWRRWRGVSGLGMGDAKFLFGLMLWRPFAGLVSFAAGLVLMAAAGLLTRRRALPLIPYIVAACVLVGAVGAAGAWVGLPPIEM